MPKAAKKDETKNSGSSSRKGKNGNGGNGKAKPPVIKDATDEAPVVAGTTGTSAATAAAAPEKKRRGRAATEGEPLRRVLIFLSDLADRLRPSPPTRTRSGASGGECAPEALSATYRAQEREPSC